MAAIETVSFNERQKAKMPDQAHQPTRDFDASLSTKAKMVTYGVGFGVGFGVPLVLGISFAVGFGTLFPLILPLVFALVLLLAWLHRTIGYQINPRVIAILRPIGPKTIEIANVRDVRFPASKPPGYVIGLWRVEGVFGTQGTYWNKSWGKFRVYVTNDENTVEVLLKNGERVLLSPDDPERFVAEFRTLVEGIQ